jgi:hypothetical protein
MKQKVGNHGRPPAAVTVQRIIFVPGHLLDLTYSLETDIVYKHVTNVFDSFSKRLHPVQTENTFVKFTQMARVKLIP